MPSSRGMQHRSAPRHQPRRSHLQLPFRNAHVEAIDLAGANLEIVERNHHVERFGDEILAVGHDITVAHHELRMVQTARHIHAEIGQLDVVLDDDVDGQVVLDRDGQLGQQVLVLLPDVEQDVVPDRRGLVRVLGLQVGALTRVTPEGAVSLQNFPMKFIIAG